ncbi:MAG: hypothetical protein JKY53_14165, partial [Flavobacteriales bacterium]|nr:hypothetical protein [Flavobacteriales bacterium]
MSYSKFTDTPIETEEQESLGVSKYAKVLSRFIMSCESPITIGIQGDWGIGKTSMLNLLKSNLAPSRGRSQKYHTIYFNTWQYSQFNSEEFLGLSILKGIIAEIQTLESLKDIQKGESFKETLNNFGGFIANLGNQITKKQVGVDIQDALKGNEDPLAFIDQDTVSYIKKLK